MRINIAPFLKGAGLLLTTYSLIREAFGFGIPPISSDPHSPASAGTMYLLHAEEFMLRIGSKIGLVPTEHPITATDRWFDAAFAIAGFLMLAVAALIQTVEKLRRR